MFLQLFMVLILARMRCVLCDDLGPTLVIDAADGSQVNGYGDIENPIKELVITTSKGGERKDAAAIQSTKRSHQRTRRRPTHQTGRDYDGLGSVLEVLFHMTSENGENNALHTSLDGNKAVMTSVAPLMKGLMPTQNSNVEDDINRLTVFPESHGVSVTDTIMEGTTNKKSEETDIPFSERNFEIRFKLWHMELFIFCIFVLILCVISAIFLCKPTCLREIRSKRDSMYVPLTDVSDDASDDDDLLIINFSKRTDEYRDQCRVDFMGLDPESTVGTLPFNLGREIENTSISIADEPLSRLPGSFSVPPSSAEETWRQSNLEFEALIESIPGRFTFLDE